MVIWIIGLSGAGKTTLGRAVYDLYKKEAPNTVFVDGDEMRRIFKHDQSAEAYTIEGRRENAQRICELCAWLDRQKVNVVCCILSIFEESRLWNRRTYSKYFEVYISVPLEVLKRRDPKGMYAAALEGNMRHVVGVDIPFVPPGKPDYVVDNSADNVDLNGEAAEILKRAKDSIQLP